MNPWVQLEDNHPSLGLELSHRNGKRRLSISQEETSRHAKALLYSHLLPASHSGSVSRETDKVRSTVKTTQPTRMWRSVGPTQEPQPTQREESLPLFGADEQPPPLHLRPLPTPLFSPQQWLRYWKYSKSLRPEYYTELKSSFFPMLTQKCQ